MQIFLVQEVQIAALAPELAAQRLKVLVQAVQKAVLALVLAAQVSNFVNHGKSRLLSKF
jgi:hypothetical protein